MREDSQDHAMDLCHGVAPSLAEDLAIAQELGVAASETPCRASCSVRHLVAEHLTLVRADLVWRRCALLGGQAAGEMADHEGFERRADLEMIGKLVNRRSPGRSPPAAARSGSALAGEFFQRGANRRPARFATRPRPAVPREGSRPEVALEIRAFNRAYAWSLSRFRRVPLPSSAASRAASAAVRRDVSHGFLRQRRCHC